MATLEKRIPKAGGGWETVPKADWGKRHPGAQWRVKVRRKGFPEQTATFERKTDAEAWARKVEEEMRQGRHFGPSESKRHTFADLCTRYAADALAQKKASTQATQRAQLEWFKRELGHLVLRDVTAPAVDDALRKRAAIPYRGKLPTPTTINRWLALVAHVLAAAVRWGWLDDNPARRLSKAREPRGRVNWLEERARARLFAAADGGPPWFRPALVVLIRVGLRLGELQRLRWPDVDMRRNLILVHESKNGERRSVPLTDDALEELRQWARVRRLDDDRVFPSAGNWHRAWYAALERAEADGGPILGEDGERVRTHDLRHTCASLLIQSGSDLATVAAVLGHKQIEVTRRYAHLSESFTRGAVAAMGAKFRLDPR